MHLDRQALITEQGQFVFVIDHLNGNKRWEKLLDKILNMTAKKMDWECEDGIPGSDFTVEGLFWFSSCLSKTESTAFKTDPPANHKASASCLQITKTAKRALTIHLLCKQQQH